MDFMQLTLQTLRVRHSSTLRELKVTTPLPKLNHLEIIDCPEIRNLELRTRNLVCITYRGPHTSLCFKELPSLTRANLDHNFLTIDAGQFPCYFSRLKSLVLDLNKFSLKMFDQSEIPELPLLEYLEHVNVSPWGYHLKGYIGWCTMLLRACPKLHRFVLKIKEGLAFSDFSDKKASETPGREVKYVHNLVKVVEITGYNNLSNYIELVRQVLYKFPSVEKVIVDPLFRKRKSYKQSENGILIGAELRDLLPVGTELVVFKALVWPSCCLSPDLIGTTMTLQDPYLDNETYLNENKGIITELARIIERD
ncbi:uncharacterized protein LOC141613252 [Silene latifolia]|uniref:uncharacterized protein LOC141613252 n=1 Tax=Silene latifolia TaxID=37657 RepID=UPI003D7848B0